MKKMKKISKRNAEAAKITQRCREEGEEGEEGILFWGEGFEVFGEGDGGGLDGREPGLVAYWLGIDD